MIAVTRCRSISTVVQEGYRVVIWRKNQPRAIIEINRVLPFTITCKLMSSFGGCVRNGGECRRVRKNGEPHHDCPSPARFRTSSQGGSRSLKGLFELSGFEGDLSSLRGR